jgi:hypothetical protein
LLVRALHADQSALFVLHVEPLQVPTAPAGIEIPLVAVVRARRRLRFDRAGAIRLFQEESLDVALAAACGRDEAGLEQPLGSLRRSVPTRATICGIERDVVVARHFGYHQGGKRFYERPIAQLSVGEILRRLRACAGRSDDFSIQLILALPAMCTLFSKREPST